MDNFDETKDYKSLHLEWIKANRGFRPKTAYPAMFDSYFDFMSSMYYEGTIKLQRTAFLYLKDDYNWLKRSRSVNTEVAQLFGDKPDTLEKAFFITFNFDSKKFKADQVVKAVSKVFDKTWVDAAYGVFEYHTETGCHPHFMMKLVVNKYDKKGKLLDKMAESCLAKFTSGKNFIDVRPFLKEHEDYLQLDKAIEKKDYLEKDVIWRKENNLPEFLKK